LVHYNGANFHYYVWNDKQKGWVVNEKVLCDPEQSNTGWNVSLVANQEKTLKELRAGEGTKPVYTGRCYAEHIKSR
jgi:hypothetical protein